MELILHAGTPKTGTTALQHFLLVNGGALAREGVHYAHSAAQMNAEILPSLLRERRVGAVRKFFRQHAEAARRKNAKTVIVSAESLYGLAVMSSLRSRTALAAPLDAERKFLEVLRACIPAEFDRIRVAIYFRRPDWFAESFYNQNVKGSLLLGLSFDEYLSHTAYNLRYFTYMRLWSETFGKGSCSAYSYEAARTNVIEDFMKKVLSVVSLSGYATPAEGKNDRICRDILEFKRMINGRVSLPEKAVEYRFLSMLREMGASTEPEPKSYQEFLSPTQRAALLIGLRAELQALSAEFDVPPFPPFDPQEAERTWRPYPGLSAERFSELKRLYDHFNRRVDVRAERAVRKTLAVLKRPIRLSRSE